MTTQQRADALVDAQLENELAASMRRKLNRLSRAQALAWQMLSRHEQHAFLDAVDRMATCQPSPSAGSAEQQRLNDAAQRVTR
jgi:hypothetical protein